MEKGKVESLLPFSIQVVGVKVESGALRQLLQYASCMGQFCSWTNIVCYDCQ